MGASNGHGNWDQWEQFNHLALIWVGLVHARQQAGVHLVTAMVGICHQDNAETMRRLSNLCKAGAAVTGRMIRTLAGVDSAADIVAECLIESATDVSPEVGATLESVIACLVAGVEGDLPRIARVIEGEVEARGPGGLALLMRALMDVYSQVANDAN